MRKYKVMRERRRGSSWREVLLATVGELLWKDSQPGRSEYTPPHPHNRLYIQAWHKNMALRSPYISYQ